jgi:serine O-acetyltransferase
MDTQSSRSDPFSGQDIQDHVLELGRRVFEMSRTQVQTSTQNTILEKILPATLQDLLAYHEGDPSIRHKPLTCLISPYSTFFAILGHRIAHHLIGTSTTDLSAIRDAMHISFYVRSQTGVDIHPEAKIGQRFVVDHGWGTVIGQTVEIGDDCYVLNNVTLGGRVAANAPDGKRHPTLGNRVQVCARAKIFGPVKISDDCFIGPDMTITTDICKGTTILNENDIPYAIKPQSVTSVYN